MPTRIAALAGGLLASLPILLWTVSAPAQERRDDAYRPYDQQRTEYPDNPRDDAYRRPLDGSIRPAQRDDTYRPPRDDAYRPPGSTAQGYGQPYPAPPPTRYGEPYPAGKRYGEPHPAEPPPPARYGEPYRAPPEAYDDPRDRGPPPPRAYDDGPPEGGGYSSREILDAGHGFFGSISKGLANVIEYSFRSKGRPNGYILGQDAGGAFVAGLRYGEGVLYTKDAGTHRVYWQGPSIGWDAGAEGSKVMVLVYNLRDPEQIYQRFAGVAGSAYFVGGVGITFQESDDVIVAPIRAGVGLRLGANVGYLKYTRRPTWNPF
jgi:hypothetical protein